MEQEAVIAAMPEDTLAAQSAKRPSFKRVKKEELPKETKPKPVQVAKESKPVQKAEAIIVQPQVVQETYSISSLIEIKNYVAGLINGNFNTQKSKMQDLQKISTLLDAKIVDMILADDFKEFVNFKEADAAVRAAAVINNIKSTLPNTLYR
jgi:hypothetical protein